MRLSLITPSYAQGFARSAGEAANPNLWVGLLGAWIPMLGPTGGVVYDISGYGNHGALTNMDVATDWIVGEKGYALDFDGGNDYGEVGSVEKLRIYGNVTLSLWMNIRNVAANSYIAAYAAKGETENTNLLYGINLQAGGDVFIGHEYDAGDNQIQIYATGLNTGQWYNLVCVRDVGALTWKLYVNGVQFGITYVYTDQATGGADATFHIGRNSSGLGFDGQIGSVQICNRALFPNEITQLYQDPLALVRMRDSAIIVPSGFIPYPYPLHEMTGGIAV